MNIQNEYSDNIPVYTNGLGDGFSVACATGFLPNSNFR